MIIRAETRRLFFPPQAGLSQPEPYGLWLQNLLVYRNSVTRPYYCSKLKATALAAWMPWQPRERVKRVQKIELGLTPRSSSFSPLL